MCRIPTELLGTQEGKPAGERTASSSRRPHEANLKRTGSDMRPVGAEEDRALCRTQSIQSAKVKSFCEVHVSNSHTGAGLPYGNPAICIQEVDVHKISQFTLINASSCARHRHTSQVIHRSKSFRIA